MINKELLLVPGDSKMSIVNVKEHKLVRVIEASGSGEIYGICLLSENMLLTGDYAKIISGFCWR